MATGSKNEFRNMPISNAVYGEDHPEKVAERRIKEKKKPIIMPAPEPHHSQVASLIDEGTLKRLTRKYPRIRPLLVRRKRRVTVCPGGSCNSPHSLV